MAWSDVLGVVSKVAPSIATALGGPLAGSAVQFGLNALGVKPKDGASTDEKKDVLSAAILGATPEQLLQLRQADIDFQVQMSKIGFENAEALATLTVKDRDSARQREVSVKDYTPRILGYLIVAAFLGIAYGVMFHKMTADSVLAGTIIGYVSAKAEQVVAFYFGSSSAQEHTTTLLSQSSPVPAEPVTVTTTKK